MPPLPRRLVAHPPGGAIRRHRHDSPAVSALRWSGDAIASRALTLIARDKGHAIDRLQSDYSSAVKLLGAERRPQRPTTVEALGISMRRCADSRLQRLAGPRWLPSQHLVACDLLIDVNRSERGQPADAECAPQRLGTASRATLRAQVVRLHRQRYT
jgi:hypothetical protein